MSKKKVNNFIASMPLIAKIQILNQLIYQILAKNINEFK